MGLWEHRRRWRGGSSSVLWAVTAEQAASGFGLGRISFLLRRRFGGTFESEVLGEFCRADG